MGQSYFWIVLNMMKTLWWIWWISVQGGILKGTRVWELFGVNCLLFSEAREEHQHVKFCIRTWSLSLTQARTCLTWLVNSEQLVFMFLFCFVVDLMAVWCWTFWMIILIIIIGLYYRPPPAVRDCCPGHSVYLFPCRVGWSASVKVSGMLLGLTHS